MEPNFANSIKESPICRDLFYAIRLLAKPGSTVLELGSGAGSTPALSKFYDLYSIEHQLEFVGKFNDASKYIQMNLDSDAFYSDEKLATLNILYSLLLIDGPDTESRIHQFSLHLDFFNKSVPWVFDDYQYQTHWQTELHELAEKTGREILVFGSCKPFCVFL